MKLYHIADLHLASPMQQLKDKALSRRQEIFQTFADLVGKARLENVGVLMLAGDIFDSNSPLMRDKKAFYKLIEDYPDICFLYLRGNHDLKQTYDRDLPNLKTFAADSWTTYRFDGLTVSGREVTSANAATIGEGLSLSPDDYNIVMLHGTVRDTPAAKNGCIIPLDSLKDRNIDYIALGHYHSYQTGILDKRGIWAYSGCLEGRGYDECGPKGYVEVDTASGHKFVPFARREVALCQVDLSDFGTDTAAIKAVCDAIKPFDRECMLKVELTGKTRFDNIDLPERIARQAKPFYHLKIKDLTSRFISIDEYEHKNSLIGEFIRIVRNDDSLTEDERQIIYKIGIDALV